MISIVEKDAVCRIERDRATLLECPVAFDPQAALEVLRAINDLRDAEDRPIYTRYREAGVPMWSMVQEHLYWQYLQPFIKYRPIIDWLAAHPEETVQTTIPGILAWLDLLAWEGRNAPLHATLGDGCRHWFEEAFLILNAALVGVWSRLRGYRFLLWSLNCVWGNRWIDFRLKDVYGALWEQGVPFLEGFPFPGFKTVVQRWWGSRRPAFYTPHFLRVTPAAFRQAQHFDYHWGSIAAMPPPLLRPLIRWMEAMSANAQLHAGLVGRLLRLAGIRRVIGIDEHSSFGALIAAARAQAVETIGLQHGVFHKYSIGWTTPGIPHEFTAGYDRILVWGEFWRELLCELSTTYRDARLVPAGFIRPSTISLRRRTLQPTGTPFRILLPYEFLANPEEINAYVEAFHARGFQVLFKVRFDDTLETQLQMLDRSKLELVSDLTQEILDTIHVCAGTSTTMMYELYYLNIPIWFIRTRHDSNLHMVEHGLAADITLDKLRAPDFDPRRELVAPIDPARIFSTGDIPSRVIHLTK